MSAGSAIAPLIDARYRLGEVLGTGGAAVVRRACDERLGRDVAVKLFHPGNDKQRQSDELALMASLAHPALVRMYDGGQTSDVNGAPSTYLVMEYVEGPTLRSVLDLGAMNRSDVAAIGADLASALTYLHGRGVVHRDVKPANVLLPHDEGVAAKLGDFGVALVLDGARVTATGITVGTANYLSPEQVRGQPVGPPSDVYSLGLVLLEALTGQITYSGVGVAAALARLDRPPVIPAPLGPAWTSLLAAMLRTAPAARPNAVQVRNELGRLGTGVLPDAAVGPSGIVERPTAQARHGAAASWPDSYLLHEEAGRRLRPLVTFLLMGASAAAIVIGILAVSAPGGAPRSPAAPVVPSGTSAPTSASPSRPPVTSTGRTGPAKPAAPATSAQQIAKPAAGSDSARSRGRAKTAGHHGHGKAKGHSRHGGG